MASIGSRLAARRAGRYDAATATNANNATIAANVTGSVGLTPTSRLVISRVIASAATSPTTIPAMLRRNHSPTTRLRMLPRGAPNTMRIPISAVR